MFENHVFKQLESFNKFNCDFDLTISIFALKICWLTLPISGLVGLIRRHFGLFLKSSYIYMAQACELGPGQDVQLPVGSAGQ